MGETGCTEGNTGMITTFCNAKQFSNPNKSTRDLPFKTPDAVHLNHQTSIISDRQDQDFKFQRSCSTRKKSRREKNNPNVSNLDAGSHSGKLFRYLINIVGRAVQETLDSLESSSKDLPKIFPKSTQELLCLPKTYPKLTEDLLKIWCLFTFLNLPKIYCNKSLLELTLN